MNAIEAAYIVLQRMDADIAKVKDFIERDTQAGIEALGGGWKPILHVREQRAAMLRDAVRQWRLDDADDVANGRRPPE